MMAKKHPILALLLTLALLLQSYGEVRANESDCCPDDCSMDAAFCPMLSAGGTCVACQTAAISHYTLNATAETGSDAGSHGSAVNSDSVAINNIWRPPIVVWCA